MVLARLAIKRAGSVGVIAFGAGASRSCSSRAARGRASSQSSACSPPASAATASPRPGALAGALDRLMTLTNRPGLVAVVSDFRDQHDWLRPLTAGRRAPLGFRGGGVRSARGALPSVGRIALVDPESGRRVEVDTSSAAACERDSRSSSSAAATRSPPTCGACT